MPAICDPITLKLSENLNQSFKKTEKENFENHLTPTAKQVLSAKIEYEPAASYNSSILTTLQTKYIVLKPNQPAFSSSNGNTPKSQQNITNGKHHFANTNGSSTSNNLLPQPKRTLFPRDNVHVGWHNLGRNWSSGCGFNNVGNTCYLNSTLQAFFHVPALAQWLISDREHREKGNCQSYQSCIICAMAQTLLNSQRQGSITPSLITNRLHNICKHLTLGRQEDAHEFLRYLVEQMEKTFLNRFKSQPWFKELDQISKETTPLNQILGGYLRSTVTCLACKYESITFQHFEDLPLDISRVSSLNEALGGYFARENLEECGYKCESCKKKVSATKRFSLERAPVVLCIQLKRFNAMGGKMSKQIQISQFLNLEKHLAKSGDPNQNCYYKLVSLVTHLGGSASGGHYTAIGLAPNSSYYQFDDSYVSCIATESVLKTNAYVLFYELVNKQKQNGNSSLSHTNFYQNEHTYSKSSSSTSSSATPPSRSDFDLLRESFAKPILPKMIPSSIMRQSSHIKQKENETTPPTKIIPSTSKFNGITNGSKVATQLFPSVKSNGVKREASDHEVQNEETVSKKLKPSLPSLPRLTTEEIVTTTVIPTTSSPEVSLETDTLSKPKSLVPYETDDEDDEPGSTTNGASQKSVADHINFCRTSSGVFVETDLKENSSPSKHGSTVDKTVVTKASLTNGSAVNGAVNGKSLTNGCHVKRNDDTIQQLAKLNHSGYGTSEVVSWNNTASNMNREVDKDQQDDRKRQLEDDDDLEMDSGRMKKVKYMNRYSGPQSSVGHQGKLPNPFQEQQNVQNQNGSFRPNQSSFYNNDRMNNKNYHNGPSQNRHNCHGGGKFNKGNYKQRDGYNGYNGQHRYNGNKFHNNGNKRHYDRR